MLFTVFTSIIKGEPTKTGYVARFCKSVFAAFIISNIFTQFAGDLTQNKTAKAMGTTIKRLNDQKIIGLCRGS